MTKDEFAEQYAENVKNKLLSIQDVAEFANTIECAYCPHLGKCARTWSDCVAMVSR